MVGWREEEAKAKFDFFKTFRMTNKTPGSIRSRQGTSSVYKLFSPRPYGANVNQ